MKREKYPGTNEYIFELMLGINSALRFSSGELSTLVVNALFALEEQGQLFPGITEPEDCLRMASMQPVGYRRSALDAPAARTGRRLPTGRKRELKNRLDDVVEMLDAAVMRQRMLMAKMSSLSDKCSDPGELKDADRASAEALLAAAEAITVAVEASAKPVL